jgi:hypothetical protein
MLHHFAARARQIGRRLTRLDDQPLGAAALVVVIFLDLFILSSIFAGLARHTAQLAAPDERVPALCRSLVLDAEWNPSNRLDALAQSVAAHHAREYPYEEPVARGRQHALCAPVVTAYEAVRDDPALARDLQASLALRREMRDLRADVERMKGAYDTSLLETIAGQPSAAGDTAAIRATIAEKTATLDARVKRLAVLEDALDRDPRVRELFARVGAVGDGDREALRTDLRRMNFWYPAQRLGMEMLFLLPLVAAFFWWNARSLAAGRPLQTLVSSHLLVVVMIPVLFKLAELVYDIIPRNFLRELIALLESLKLVALWHYLLIAAAIAGALALIYLFQKKLFSREKLLQRRIARGLCQACGERLPPDSAHCPACGAAQFRPCSRCGAPTHVHGRYCRACGADSQAA